MCSQLILCHTRSPFGFKFESEMRRYYEVEKSSDLLNWSVVEIIVGNGKTINTIRLMRQEIKYSTV